MVKITADYAPTKPGKVEYTVNIPSKEYELTDDEITALLNLSVQTPEQLAESRADYEAKRAQNPYLPVFEDYFVSGHNLLNIFKYTPEKRTGNTSMSNQTSSVVVVENENDDDLSLTAPAQEREIAPNVQPSGKLGRPKASVAPVAVFESTTEDDVDEWGL